MGLDASGEIAYLWGVSTPVSSTSACLRGRCPRCGEGDIFASWLQFAPACRACGLDLSRHDTGDGAAYLTICVVGGLITVLATALEILVAPPYWLHAVLWLPMVILGSILFLHYGKAWLLAASYRHHRLGDTT
jgi:uncharacterized protein (DUF983 family)